MEESRVKSVAGWLGDIPSVVLKKPTPFRLLTYRLLYMALEVSWRQNVGIAAPVLVVVVVVVELVWLLARVFQY